jgi:sulfur transfer protein SufE
MIVDDKLSEYKDNIEALQLIDKLEVYRWMISFGKKLQEDPLSEERRTEENKVSRCQFSLFVDWEDGKFKAWSDAMIASGYAYILLDVFNSPPIEEAKQITTDHFKKIQMEQLLTMNRQNGFYQMVEMMINKIQEV